MQNENKYNYDWIEIPKLVPTGTNPTLNFTFT